MPVLLRINDSKLHRLTPTKNPFLSLASSIISQQISLKAAESIYKRFLKLFGKRKPSPEQFMSFKDVELRGIGLSGQKVKYLRDLAEKFLDGTITPKKFPNMTDEEIKEHLVQVKGIGPWTADMFLLFALNRPNVLPVGDLAIVKGFQKAFKLRTPPSEKTMRCLARPYEGQYTRLSLHLFRVYSDKE